MNIPANRAEYYKTIAQNTVVNVLKASNESGAVTRESTIEYLKNGKNVFLTVQKTTNSDLIKAIIERANKLTTNKAKQFNENFKALRLFSYKI